MGRIPRTDLQTSTFLFHTPLHSSGKLNFDWHFHSIGGFSCCCLDGFIEKYIGNAWSAKKLTFHSLWGSENKWHWEIVWGKLWNEICWAWRRAGGEFNMNLFGSVRSSRCPSVRLSVVSVENLWFLTFRKKFKSNERIRLYDYIMGRQKKEN